MQLKKCHATTFFTQRIIIAVIVLFMCMIYKDSFSMALWRKNNPFYDRKTDKIKPNRPQTIEALKKLSYNRQKQQAKSTQQQSFIATHESTSSLDTLTLTGEIDYSARKQLRKTCKYFRFYFDTRNKETLYFLSLKPFFDMHQEEMKKALLHAQWDNQEEVINAMIKRYNSSNNPSQLEEPISQFDNLNNIGFWWYEEDWQNIRFSSIPQLKQVCYNQLPITNRANITNACAAALSINDPIAIHALTQKVKELPKKGSTGKKKDDYNYYCYLELLKIAINEDNEKAFIAFVQDDPCHLNHHFYYFPGKILRGPVTRDLMKQKDISQEKKKKYKNLFKKHAGPGLLTKSDISEKINKKNEAYGYENKKEGYCTII